MIAFRQRHLSCVLDVREVMDKIMKDEGEFLGNTIHVIIVTGPNVWALSSTCQLEHM